MSFKNNCFSFLFFISILFSNASSFVEINSSNLAIPSSLAGVKLLHDENGFTIEKDGDFFPIKVECLDVELRNLSDEDLDFVLGLKAKIEIDGEEQIITRISPELTRKLMAESQEIIQLSPEDSEEIISQLPPSSYIKVFQFGDGKYGLHLKTRLPGGGFLGGAIGAVFGKAAVSVLGHGTIWIVCRAVDVVAPGAGVAANIALESVVGPIIEAASYKAALGTGVIAMVATGPV